MEYVKYTWQDVPVLRVDVAKVFDTVQWDYITEVMATKNAKWTLT